MNTSARARPAEGRSRPVRRPRGSECRQGAAGEPRDVAAVRWRPVAWHRPATEWDVAALLKLMWETWNDVFRAILGPAERSFVSELRGHRNRWAHQEPFSSDDAYRVLDTASRLLTVVSAKEASDVEMLKRELLRVRFDEQARGERRRQASLAIEGCGRDPEAVARGGRAAPGRGERPLPAGRVCCRPLAGASRRGQQRVPRSRRVLPAHLPHRQPQGHARRRAAAACRRVRRPGRATADQLRRRQDALHARVIPPLRRAAPASWPASTRCCGKWTCRRSSRIFPTERPTKWYER